jgi:N-methylhydantoinase B
VYRVAVEISDREFVVDLRDNPDQSAGSYNLGRDGSMVSAQMIFKNVTDPNGVANAGSFRPLRLLTREGSIFDAREPAAFGVYAETMIRLYDLIWRCLAPHLGGRLPAGHYASICGTFIGGLHPDTGRHFTVVEPQLGGWGASDGHDGNSGMFTGMHGDTFNCPVEVAEARYGLDVEQLALSCGPGGAGEYRGGRGIVLDYRVRGDGIFFTCAYTRAVERPWALAGGEEGSPNYVEILRAGGGRERHGVATALQLGKGDLIRIHTGNGGGYGAPSRRPRERVLHDLRDELVSREEAIGMYGLDPPTPGFEGRVHA